MGVGLIWEDKLLTIADVDSDDPDQVARYDAQVDRRADERFARACMRLRWAHKREGKRPPREELRPDISEDSGCVL